MRRQDHGGQNHGEIAKFEIWDIWDFKGTISNSENEEETRTIQTECRLAGARLVWRMSSLIVGKG
jgi:hypothetical protein